MRFLLLASLFTVALGGPHAVPERAADEVKEGDLAKGKIIDLKWAGQSNVACFPLNQAKYFSGNTEFYRFKQEKNHDIYIKLTPTGDLDVNMYALQMIAAHAGKTPPDVNDAVKCIKGWSNTGGGEEAIMVGGYKVGYTVVVGVAGARGATAGAYKLEMWHEKGRVW